MPSICGEYWQTSRRFNGEEEMMNNRMLTADDCRSVLVVAITPRLPDRSVDLIGVRGNVRHLVDRGVDFLMPECGTGLVYDVELGEYEAVVAAFMDEAGGDALVVPGIGPGYGRSLEMGRIARNLGAAGVMIMPVVGPASAGGVTVGIGNIVERVGLPTILYQRRLDIMPPDQVSDLCRLDGVVGLKYAVDDIGVFRRIATAAGSEAAIICGMAEDPCIEYMESGAVGFSSGMANFTPRLSLRLLSSFQAGDRAEAERIRHLMLPFEDFRGENGGRYSASALHAAMDCAGLAGGPVIPFAENVAEEDLPRVGAMMDTLLAEEGLLEKEASAGVNGGARG